ncbi:hypothetical protein BGZ65_004838 [Modicella reniformis]|uniref:Uncharacterized protein n=1 Tax=Modicella reniformis TaxID=1440133 RepID=A0A9P6J696_9FUNG|nr:hypothetical protein BGZ65_004838 [Modicella reniformis]
MSIQEQLRQLKQQLQQMQQSQYEMQQQVNEILQQTQHPHQQLQQRLEETLQKTQLVDEILQKMQKVEQQNHQMEHSQHLIQRSIEETRQMDRQQKQIDEFLQMRQKTDQQLQAHINETLQKSQQMDQEMFRAFNRFALVQYRVQSVLTRSFRELPIPRLFIILPKATDLVDGIGKSCSVEFRLYYLCECGSHTTGEKTKETQEIHLTKHSGYDLVNPSEFFGKYGMYILIMMYMVKYGAKSGGHVVPLLLRLEPASEADAGEEHLDFVKKNISRLVNETIVYLEAAIGTIDGDSDASAFQKLSTLELEELKSYLQVKDGEGVSDDLSQTITQKGHCVWICNQHRRDYHELVMQQLKDVITESGGAYSEEAGDVKINIISDALTRRFYEAVVKVCGNQSTGNVLFPATLELKLDDHHSLKKGATNIIINLNNLKSLILDFGRLSVTISISHGEVKDMRAKVPQLKILTVDDAEFIKQCPGQLEVLQTPGQVDEERLVNILQHSPGLKELYIKCLGKRSIGIIDLVISTREKTIRNGGSSALRTLNLLADQETCDKYERLTCRDKIKAKASFSEGSAAFDIEADLIFEWYDVVENNNVLSDFIRRYGWSITSFTVQKSFNIHLATQLDEATRKQGSRITLLDFSPTWLTAQALASMDQVIKRSQNLTSLRLSFYDLHKKDQIEKVLLQLVKYKDQLNGLFLEGSSIVGIMIKDGLPPQIWEAVIKSIDFSTLESLHPYDYHFSGEQLKLLVDCIAESESPPVPLRLVDLRGTYLEHKAEIPALCKRLREAASRVEILGV